MFIPQEEQMRKEGRYFGRSAGVIRLRGKIVSAALAAAAVTVILAGASETAEANAALTHWEGVSLAGVVSADETCPVTVEKERLIFEIESFPDQSSEAEENRSGGSVTAEYTFYNPADYAVRARLLFPFGRLPSYAVRYDEQTGERNPLDDVERYKITAGGQPLETVLRHTYSGPEAEFDLEEDLAKLQNGYAEDTFYRPDLEVVEYTYEISGVDRGRYPAAHAWFFLEADPDETDFRIWLDGGNGMSREEDRIGVNCFAENGNEMRPWRIFMTVRQLPVCWISGYMAWICQSF